ncbi:hypothetical protein DENIS_3295 [Desulfonema ishimotonii]|uniref:Class III cytochrome C domain-containing protein n=1 Tax=Desulfonema ishimotonii TaxID=45657 RepID=A0A401FZG1_9BACT|nr:cytochrome c3 family protein [Desulfonema ishimotonii]GBC62326.1 hypothetical protein DENIS_3295 [Desulfonema ishimotonii]
MVKGKKKFWWVGVLIAVFMISTYCIGGEGMKELFAADQSRADIITIDTLRVFGYLEKPEVVFLHDAHTDALEKKGKDCATCHFAQKNTGEIPGTFNDAVKSIDPLSPKFKRLEDTARKEVMDVYHKFCIDCHTQMSAEGDKSGPVTCGECHRETVEVTSARQPMGMNKSLHYRHVKIHEKKENPQEKQCGICHHEYNAEKKELVYVKEKEGTCRYCHLENASDIPAHMKDSPQLSRLSMREASHLDCISCHRKTLAKNEMAGPVKCAGCHADESQKKFRKVADVPRMERKQPDAVRVSTGEKVEKDADRPGAARMEAVLYDHKAHEANNDTCRVCHHASMDKCSKCHTVDGTKDGNFVKLEQAFHRIGNDNSCLGCHELNQRDPKCSGCHIFMEKQRRQPDASCLKCHQKLTPEMEAAAEKTDDKALARMMAEQKTYTLETYEEKDIPEKVVISAMRDTYEAVELPHRKIVRKLQDNIRDNKMATFFHREKGTLCQGCHHNSPASAKPPKCASCHGRPFDEKQPNRPGLMGAYHQQCMTCHKEMKLEKPAGCLGCHKENKEKI